jgi:hypothetical protein
MEFMPEHAPLVVMAFLGTIVFLASMALVILVPFLTKRKWIGLVAMILGLVLASGYALVLVGVSLTSHEKTLAPGENKYFCEIDCHIAYSVVKFEEAKALGDESHQTLPAGRFVIVQLKTWFDPSTISEHRGDSPLAPSPRRVVLVDDAAHRFPQSAQGQAALARCAAARSPCQSLSGRASRMSPILYLRSHWTRAICASLSGMTSICRIACSSGTKTVFCTGRFSWRSPLPAPFSQAACLDVLPV